MRRIKNRICLFALIIFSTLPAFAVRDDVLIIVNDNSVDSPQVGAYYAQQRDVPIQNIVHVSAPNSYFMDWTQFKIMRDQIIKYMQDNTFAPGVQPVVCTDGEPPYYCQASMDQMRANTGIRYIVTTRGVPTRVKVDGSTLPSATAPGAVDSYLKYWLVRYFSTDVFFNFQEREFAFGNGSTMRTVDTANDGELIVGRVDGLNLQLAKNLVDRAIVSEQNGIFGRLYSNVGNRTWKNFDGSSSVVYPPASSGNYLTIGWRYQLGIWGESDSACIDYLNFPGNTAQGKSPSYCKVHFNDDVDQFGGITIRPPVGFNASRQLFGYNALVYNGWLDGQAMNNGSFTAMLNWRKNESSCTSLCTDETCRSASTDIFREINTSCVGVADGFMGYNFTSYAASYFTLWPTGYTGSFTGDFDQMAFPEVREDIGFNDNFSLWFRNNDQVGSPTCYTSSDFSSPPQSTCRDQRKLFLRQQDIISPITINTSQPQTFEIQFQFKGENVTQGTTLSVNFETWEPASTPAKWIDYGTVSVGTLTTGNSGWTTAVATFTINPALHTSSTITQLLINITSGAFIGDLGIDALTVKDTSTQIDYAQNGEFDQGHKQTAPGDHAANMLNRLSGVAAWGSVGHHATGGGSFSGRYADMVYFFRGLPLGDAVWFDDIPSVINDGNNSGVFYGDPLYSPIAVRLLPVNMANSTMGRVPLYGSAINGRDFSIVNTSYTVEYCAGTPAAGSNPEYGDFYNCDQAGSWQPTGISNFIAVDNNALGEWDARSLATGPYTLRLSVTSTNTVSGASQTFHDYYNVHIDKDSDDDGVADVNDNCTLVANGPKTYPTGSPLIQRDTNGDGYGNMCDADYNNDLQTNTVDFAIFRKYFGLPDDGSTEYDDVDFNGDGSINTLDFGFFRSRLNLAPGPAGALP